MRAHLPVLVLLITAVSAMGAHTLTAGEWTATLSPQGRVEQIAGPAGTVLIRPGEDSGVQLVFPSQPPDTAPVEDTLPCNDPTSVRPIANGLTFEYPGNAQTHLNVLQEISFLKCGDLPVLRRKLTLAPTEAPFKRSLVLQVPCPAFDTANSEWFIPGHDGRAVSVETSRRRVLRYAISAPAGKEENVTPLAIPMLSTSDPLSGLRITQVADPLTTVDFRVDRASAGRAGSLTLVFPCDGAVVPLAASVSFTLWTIIHDGPPDRAMDAWYATALADVPPGPAWLHDVAMHLYDYLSHGGKGWFEDIDIAEKLIGPPDRGKMVFTLHGWYDMLGRYTFDAKSGKLDDAWTAFPNAPNVKDRFPTSESVALTRAEMHRRIRYAKDRGFRVCLYFADGLTACEGAGLLTEDKRVSWGGWEGPDTVGKPYMQNPDHPDVYKWYLDYHRALLAEYGREIDALVWDETFMIRAGMVAPSSAPRPAYLAPVFMRLVRDLTQATTRFNQELAFLTSDCQGATFDEKSRWLDVPPYAIMAHGTYQDSHSRPSVWPYGIFANYRNVLWSCNWQAVTHFDYTRFGVEHYGTPIAVTNGWLDDRGLARLDDAQRAAVMELFAKRKDKPQQLRWLSGPAPAFEGR